VIESRNVWPFSNLIPVLAENAENVARSSGSSDPCALGVDNSLIRIADIPFILFKGSKHFETAGIFMATIG
jgi:hypothetical protein